MDQGSLVAEQIEAGNRFLREFEKSTPVVLAFWKREGEDGQWNLFVASNRFDNGRVAAAYGDILRIGTKMKDPHFDPFRVTLVGLDEPGVQSALEFSRTHPPKIPFHTRELNF